MKILFVLLSMGLGLNVYALEVGEVAPCVVLNQVQNSGSEREHCIREPNVEGQKKVLEFFQTTCSDCQKNLPYFLALAYDNKEKVTFRLVGIDRSEDDLREFTRNNAQLGDIEVALDIERDAKKAYGITTTPTLFILDAADIVLYKHVGVLDQESIAEIAEILK